MHKNQETFFSRKLSEQARTHTDECHTFIQTTLIAQIRFKSKSSRLSSMIAISVLWRNLFKIQNTFWIETFLNCLYRGEQIERIQNISTYKSSSKKIRF